MFARTTSMLGQPTAVDTGIEFVREEVLPSVRSMPGCIGLSMLADRSSGRSIVTSAWESEAAMLETEGAVASMRDRAAEIFDGNPVVERWEIAVLHRHRWSDAGACVRVIWMTVPPSEVDRAIDVYRFGSLPSIEALDGFCSASLLVDRASGRAVSSASYESLGAMERSRDQAATIRSTGARDAGAQVVDIGEFELALAHLHVPELA